MPDRLTAPRPRVRASYVAARIGLSVRTVTDQAIAGKVPGAAKLGGSWTFDPDAIEDWIKREEARACQKPAGRPSPPASMPAMEPSGAVSRSRDANIDEAYARLIRRRPLAD